MGVAGAEALVGLALGVPRGVLGVPPEAEGLGPRAPAARGVPGTPGWWREWERPLLAGGRGSAGSGAGSVRGAPAGCTARKGVSLGLGDRLPRGVAGGVQKRAWSLAVSPLAIQGASQPEPAGLQPKSDSSQ